MKTFPGVDGWVGGWLENEFLKKTPSPKFGLESQLGTSDFGVCQKKLIQSGLMDSVRPH